MIEFWSVKGPQNQLFGAFTTKEIAIASIRLSNSETPEARIIINDVNEGHTIVEIEDNEINVKIILKVDREILFDKVNHL